MIRPASAWLAASDAKPCGLGRNLRRPSLLRGRQFGDTALVALKLTGADGRLGPQAGQFAHQIVGGQRDQPTPGGLNFGFLRRELGAQLFDSDLELALA